MNATEHIETFPHLKHMIGPFEMMAAPPQHAERLLRHGLALASAQAPMVCEPNISGIE